MSNLGGKTVSEDTDKDNQGLDTVVAGTNIDNIDSTDPRNPIINASAGGDVATDTIFDAKGDLAGGTGSDTAARLAVGTNDQVLTADSAEATGMKWATAAGGGGSISGAHVRRDTDLPITTDTKMVWQTESYDDNSFIDLGTNNDRMTVPTGVTRVNLSMTVRTTATVTFNTNFVIRINHFNSSDSFLESVAESAGTAGFSTHAASCVILGLPVTAGDYFECRTSFGDTTVTLDYVTATIQDVTP